MLLALGPLLRQDEACLDGLAKADFIGEQHALGQRRIEGEQGGVNLVGVQVNLSARDRTGEALIAPGGETAGQAIGWLWATISAAALSRTASRNTSPTRTIELLRLPW